MKKIASRTVLSILAVTVWAVAVGMAGPVAAENGEYVRAIHVVADHHATPNTIIVYNVPEEGYPLERVTEFQVPSHGIGAGGLATFYDPNGDGYPDDGIVFVTFENLEEAASANIEMFRAVSGDYLGNAQVAGAQDLAGVVVDQAEQRLYVLDRFTNHLYVYDIVVGSTVELIPIPGLPIKLSNIIGQRSKIYFANKGAVGLALDEDRDRLFVTDITPIVRYYDTNTWAELGSFDMNNVNDRPWWEVMAAKNAKAISIAYDPEQQLVFVGGGYRHDYYLRKYDMKKGSATFLNLSIVPGMGAMGLVFDPESDLLYVTTGYEGDDLRIFDRNLNQVYLYPDTEGLIKNPAGICIGPPAEQQFLHLSKDDGIDDDKWVVPGGNIAYDLCVENPGGSAVENVLLNDELPFETEFVSASDGGLYDSYTHTVTWELETIEGQGSKCVELTVRVKTTTPIGTVVINTSVADSDQTPPTQPVTEETLVGNGLVLTKVDDVPDGQWVEAGDDITYELCVGNSTPFDVHEVILTDTLPGQTNFVAASEGGEYDAYTHTVTWDLGTLAQGEQRCVGLVVQVDPSTANGTILTNTCVAESEETGSTDPVTEETAVGDGLVLTKDDGLADGEWVQGGDNITYEMCVENLTPYAVNNVTLSDDLPEETDFVSASDQGSYNSSTHQVAWNIGTLGAGEKRCVELAVTVKLSTVNGTVVMNSCVADSDETEPTDPVTEDTLVGNGLVLTKDDGLDEGEWVGPGDNITYELCVENLTPVTLHSVTLTDSLPLETDFVSAPEGGIYHSSSHSVTWDLGTLGLGEKKCVELVVNVKSTTPNGTIVNNSCIADSDETNPTDPVEEDTPVGDGVVVTKDDGVEEGEWVEPGEEISYEICVDNLTPFPLHNATIIDTLPVNTNFISATAGGTYQSSTHTVTWDLGTVAAGEKQCASLVVEVDSGTPCGTMLTNCIVMESDETGATDPECEDTPVGCGLVVTKDDGVPEGEWVKQGDNISYALCVENLTPFALHSVTLTDGLPAETDFVSASDAGTYQSGPHTVTWNIGTLSAGEKRCVDLVVNVKSETPSGTVVRNSCVADSDETGPTDPVIEETPVGDNLVVSKNDGMEDDEWVEPGDNITYDLCVENLTPFSVTDTTVTDTLPAETDFVSASDQGEYHQSTHTVTWNLGTLVAGEIRCIDLVVNVSTLTPFGTTVTNTCYADSAETDPTDPVTEETAVGDGLVVSKNDGMGQGEWVEPGDNITYGLCVTNLTPFDVHNATLTDSLPDETDFVSASNGGSYNSSTHTVTWDLGTLAQSQEQCVDLVASVKTSTPLGTVVVNSCVADSDETGPTAPVVEDTPVGDGLVVTKNDGLGQGEWVEPGEEITYEVCVRNLTPFAVHNVTLTDSLPPETDFVDATEGGNYSSIGHTVTWNLGTLEADEERCVGLVATVKTSTPFGTIVRNSCVADSDETDPTEPVIADTPVGDGLVITKDDGVPSGEWVERGDNITYAVCVENQTPFAVHNATITDTLPLETTFVSASDEGIYSTTAHTVTWNLGMLEAGEQRCVQLVARVRTSTPVGTVVTNAAVADSDETEPTAPVIEETLVGDGLVVRKDDGLGPDDCVEPGDFITYEVCVQNQTPITVHNVILTDHLDPDTIFQSASDGGTYDSGNHAVTWDMGNLAAGEEQCVNLLVQVDAATMPASVVTDSCVADSDETDPSDPDTEDTNICAYIDAGARPEFDAVGCDATNYFAADDAIKQLVVENGLDSFGTKINLHSDFVPYGDESFATTGGQLLPDPCFPGYTSALTDVWNEAVYEWDIVLQMKPESDIDLNIVDCVIKRNESDVWSGAEQTGRYRAAWGELIFLPTGNPRLTVDAIPGPYPTPGFEEPFYLDARTHPGLFPESLVDAPYTSKAFWEEGIIMALPETGTTNGVGQTVYNLKQGDIIRVQVAVPAWNTVDIRYGRDNVILKYVGILGTEHITDEPCAQ
ncbi:MAG: hypothetical protein SWQ30_01605 [Thermodesulfobacteriota bacterium]|nr:hypothetical protein [Thermodesulfobacteriota bacterium]